MIAPGQLAATDFRAATWKLTTHGNYTYNFIKGCWERAWSLNSLSSLASDFPVWRSYITGHVKPSRIGN